MTYKLYYEPYAQPDDKQGFTCFFFCQECYEKHGIYYPKKAVVTPRACYQIAVIEIYSDYIQRKPDKKSCIQDYTDNFLSVIY